MEHIRKALEQAERERTQPGSQESDQVATKIVDQQDASKAPDTGTQAAEATIKPTDVRYRRTKTINVAPEIFERHRVVAALPLHEHADSYRMLRTRVLQKMKLNGWNALAVTSPATGSGKTLTAINLAISLAREVNNTVLLVDLDLRNPSIHKYFDYQPEFGIADYLQGQTPIEDVLFSPGIERLVVLPGREAIINSAETLRSPKMVNLVAELKGRYPDRVVICDLPPILATDDALAFAPYTDAMLMVAEAGSTNRDDLEQSFEVLGSVPLLGTVLNKSESAPKNYYGQR